MSPASPLDDFSALANRRTGAPALLWRDSTVTYAELAELVQRAGVALAGLDLADRAPIAVRATKSPESIALILACLSAGRPVLVASADLGPRVLETLIRRAGCKGVAVAADTGGLVWRPADPTSSGAPLTDDTCILLTTSGSTGTPKIVPLAAGAVHRFTGWAGATFGLGIGSRVLNYAPLNFDLCLLDVWATLRHGGCVVLVDPDRAVDSRYLLRLVNATEPHVVQAVPMLFRLLSDAAGDGVSFPSIRHVLLTGDHTPRRLRARLPGTFPNAVFHNVYGCTETNDSFMYSFSGPRAANREVLPLGEPLPGVEAAVLTDDGVLHGPGDGELLVSTPFQTDGYLGDDGPDGRFVRRAAGSGTRTFFRTGDVVSRDADGELTLVGRNDFQVKVRGVRVNLEEIERVILGHEDVLEAAVVALPDAEAGVRLHALVRRARDELSSLQLRAYCAAGLARVAIPTTFDLVDHPLPIGPTGKVSRSRIKDDLLKGSA